MSFLAALRATGTKNDSLLCVGLDPELARLPDGIARTPAGVLAFNRAIVEATADLVCAYKPNFAFYEALGPEGMEILRQTRRLVPAGIPVIGDAKRGDIGNTARAYAEALFERLEFDAVTVNPYLGRDAIEPFLAYRDRGVLIICRTSNPGAAEIQNLLVEYEGTRRPLYEVMALRVRSWNANGNAGLVVGATAPTELEAIRALAPDLPILVPGVGAQGGDLAAAARAHRPGAPAIVSASRAVLYASSGPDFAAESRRAAQRLRDALGAAACAI
ncbi:MAG TPA: orotidine-5'-phosphate decarboxylase [Chloroflexota bacterium]|nr:orotidine-5'-phosphate decarboxylase [Chloroflexota bacterium]